MAYATGSLTFSGVLDQYTTITLNDGQSGSYSEVKLTALTTRTAGGYQGAMLSGSSASNYLVNGNASDIVPVYNQGASSGRGYFYVSFYQSGNGQDMDDWKDEWASDGTKPVLLEFRDADQNVVTIDFVNQASGFGADVGGYGKALGSGNYSVNVNSISMTSMHTALRDILKNADSNGHLALYYTNIRVDSNYYVLLSGNDAETADIPLSVCLKPSGSSSWTSTSKPVFAVTRDDAWHATNSNGAVLANVKTANEVVYSQKGAANVSAGSNLSTTQYATYIADVINSLAIQITAAVDGSAVNLTNDVDSADGNVTITTTDTTNLTILGMGGGGSTDTTAPTISSVAITSATNGQNSVLNTGDVVSTTVTFDEAVTVVTSGGTPTITLNVGGVSRNASYASGTGTTAIVFTYTIAGSETTDSDGISIGANAISLNSGTMQDAAGNNATITHSAVGANSSFKVDTTAPTIASVSVASDNSTATVTFSEDVYTNSNGTGDLVVGDFSVSLSGGNSAEISLNATPSGISKTSQSVWVLTLNGTDLDSNADSTETLVVDSANDTSIYDLGGTAHTAAASGVSLNDTETLSDSASSTIGTSAGGVLSVGNTSSNPIAILSISTASLGTSTTIGIDISGDNDPQENGLANQRGMADVTAYSDLIRLTPHGTSFSSAATVKFELTGSVSGSCPSDLQIWKRNSASSTWYQIPSSLWSCSTGEITISTTSFSDYMAIGGNHMARTTAKPSQLSKLDVNNKALAKALDLTGSINGLNPTSVVSGDLFMMQKSGAEATAVSASVLQDFFSKVDVTASAASNYNYSVVLNEADGQGLVRDAGILFNPSSNALTLTGQLTAVGIAAGGAIAGATTVSGSGQFSMSHIDLDGTLNAGGKVTVVGVSDLDGGIDVNGSNFTVSTAGAIAGASLAIDNGGTIGPDAVTDLITVTSDGDLTFKDGAYDFDIASHDGSNGLKLGGTLVTSTAAEINYVDVSAIGTVEASKAVVVDANKDADGFRNISGSHALEFTSITASHARVTNLDVVTLNSISQTETTLEVQDKLIVSALSASSANADGGGLKIGGGQNSTAHASVLYDHGNTSLDLNIGASTIAAIDSAGLDVTGIISGSSFVDAIKDKIRIDGQTVTTTAAELNKLDGADGNVTAAKLSTLSALSDAEIGYVDGAGTTVVASKVVVANSDKDINGWLDMSGSGTVEASQLSGSGKVSAAGGLDAGSGRFTVSAAGAVVGQAGDLASLALNSGGITAAGAIAGATTIDASGDLTVGTITNAEFTVDASGNTDIDGTLNVEGVPTFQAAAVFSSGITTAGAIAGATTISGSGQLAVGTIAMAEFTVGRDGATDIDGTLNVEGVPTFQAGAVFSGGITTAGAIAGATTVSGSGQFSMSHIDLDGTLTAGGIVSGSSFFDMIKDKLRVDGIAVTTTAAELNLLDGDTARGTTALASGDGFVHNDGGTMRMTSVDKIADFMGGGDGIQVASGVLSIDYQLEHFSGSTGSSGLYSSHSGPTNLQRVGSSYTALYAPLAQDIVVGSLQVYLNGMLQTKSGSIAGTWDYELLTSGSSANRLVKFASEPEVDDALIIQYIKK